jgi:O-antigen/teichoic acid export membrane protein
MTGRRGWVGSGLLVAAGVGVWSVGNWVFFILVGRLLGPQDYGLVAAVLSGCLVLYVLCSSLQPTLAASNRGEPPDAIFVRALRVTIAATVGVMIAAAVIVVIVGATIARFPTAVMLGAVTVLAGIAVFPLALGQLQGERRFAAYSLGFITVGIMRPLAFLALWVAGVRVLAPLLGTATSWVIGSGVVLVLARRALHTLPIDRTSTQWHAFRKSILPNAGGVTAIAILTNADVITAKLVLGGRDAGLFAAASAIAQGLFLVPQVFTTLVLPRFAARRAHGRSSARLVATGVGVTLAAGAAVVALAIPLGRDFMRLTYGGAFQDAGDLLPFYGAAMACMGCAIVLLYHQIGRRDFRYSWYLLGIAGMQIIALAAFARSADAIITVDLLCALGAFVAHEVVTRGNGERVLDGLRQGPPLAREGTNLGQPPGPGAR